jgi:prepilin-type N-terminal cleavage/methylation domain-containing protein
MSARGYSLIEVMVAIVVFALVAAAVAQTVTFNQHSRQIAENWMRATQLAGARIEQVRAGMSTDPTPESGIFRRDTVIAALDGHRNLSRVEVTVSWTDSEARTLTLASLVRR